MTTLDPHADHAIQALRSEAAREGGAEQAARAAFPTVRVVVLLTGASGDGLHALAHAIKEPATSEAVVDGAHRDLIRTLAAGRPVARVVLDVPAAIMACAPTLGAVAGPVEMLPLTPAEVAEEVGRRG